MIGSGMERGSGQDSGGAGPKVRVYELAKELGLTNKELLEKLRGIGVEVANHMSLVEATDADRVRRMLVKQRQETLVEERLSDTVIRRRSRSIPPVAGAPAPAPPAPAVAKPAAPPAPPPRAPEPPPAPPKEATPPPVVVAKPESVVVAKPEPAPAPAPPPPPAPVVEARPVVEAPPPPPAPPPAAPPPAPTLPPAVVRPAPSPPVTGSAVVRPAPSRVAPPAPPAPAPAPVAARPAAPPAPIVEEKPPEKVFRVVQQPVVTGSAATGQFIQLPGRNVPRVEIKDRDEELRKLGRLPVTSGARDRYGRPAGNQPGQRPGGMPPRKKMVAAGKKTKATQITTPAEHKRVIKMAEAIPVSELAQKMGVKGGEVIKKLWALGMMGVNINQSVDLDTATLIATEFGYQVESTAFREEDVLTSDEAENPEDLAPRAPVVTIMGHVDHGKTSLLDAIRHANVAAGEAGGITQHIGAYKVHAPSGDVVFLDTPGHEAFTAMRARGAKMTDIVVLVCAADDGPMPQTIEALNHAKAAEVPIIVAVNKIDKPGANPQMVRNKLMEHGLVPEELGGDIMFIDVSAKTKAGIDKLLEMLALQAEVLELKANPKKAARGHIVEARLDRARGPISTVLVEEGTLRIGDLVVAGEFSGKIRAMLNDKGQTLNEAGPSTPVELLGIDGVPDAGETFNMVTDEKAAKSLVEHRTEQRRRKEQVATRGVSLENILDRIKEGDVKELKIVLKADVQGSVEAVANALKALSTPTVGVNVISQGVGGITESDVTLAKASSAIVLGFNVRPAGKAQSLAEQEGVDLKLYQIIYEAIDDVKKAMVGMLEPVTREKVLGKAEVRQTFNIPKVGTIAGSFVLEGKITRKAQVRLVRDSVIIFTGKLGSLKRFKDDASEVEKGYECGLSIDGYQDVKQGDIVEAFEIETIAATLDAPIAAQGDGKRR